MGTRRKYLRRVWSEEERARLAALYPHRPTKEVAQALGRGISGVYRMAAMRGIAKSPEFLASDESGRLKKGHEPANKGLRRPGWYAGRMRETQFQKGRARSGKAAENWAPIGSI